MTTLFERAWADAAPGKPLRARRLSSLAVVLWASLALAGCLSPASKTFAHAAPEREAVSPFPLAGVYRATPDPGVIAARSEQSLRAFDVKTGKELWSLPSLRDVGGTDKLIVAYCPQPSAVQLLRPRTGEIVKAVAPAPPPLWTKGSLEQGMAFTDTMYLTTRALYETIWKGGEDDTSFVIGLTAKAWGDDKVVWFAPPPRQVVILEYRPRIIGDKVLALSAKGGVNGPHSAQLLSLASGKELSLLETVGEFYDFPQAGLVERAPTFVRRLDPLTGKPLWKVEGDFATGAVFEIGPQMTLSIPHPDRTRTIIMLEGKSGKELTRFELPDLENTPLAGCYLAPDKTVLLHFFANPLMDIDRRDIDYWVAFDTAKGQPLWRTSYGSRSLSSLMPLVGDRMKFEAK